MIIRCKMTSLLIYYEASGGEPVPLRSSSAALRSEKIPFEFQKWALVCNHVSDASHKITESGGTASNHLMNANNKKVSMDFAHTGNKGGVSSKRARNETLVIWDTGKFTDQPRPKISAVHKPRKTLRSSVTATPHLWKIEATITSIRGTSREME